MNNSGPWLIAFLCCGWPLIVWAGGNWFLRRFHSRGIDGFIPKIRIKP